MMSFKTKRNDNKDLKDRNKKKKSGRLDVEDSDHEQPLESKPTLKVQRNGDVFTIKV